MLKNGWYFYCHKGKEKFKFITIRHKKTDKADAILDWKIRFNWIESL